MPPMDAIALMVYWPVKRVEHDWEKNTHEVKLNEKTNVHEAEIAFFHIANLINMPNWWLFYEHQGAVDHNLLLTFMNHKCWQVAGWRYFGCYGGVVGEVKSIQPYITQTHRHITYASHRHQQNMKHNHFSLLFLLLLLVLLRLKFNFNLKCFCVQRKFHRIIQQPSIGNFHMHLCPSTLF